MSNSVSGELSTRVRTILGKRKRETAPSPVSVAESLTKSPTSFDLKELSKSLSEMSSKLNNSAKKPKEESGAADESSDPYDSDEPLEF